MKITQEQFDALVELIEAIVSDRDENDLHSCIRRSNATENLHKLIVGQPE
jgi:hypothetical protein